MTSKTYKLKLPDQQVEIPSKLNERTAREAVQLTSALKWITAQIHKQMIERQMYQTPQICRRYLQKPSGLEYSSHPLELGTRLG